MDYESARTRLINHLSAEIKDKQVLNAMSHVPRELFVPPGYRHLSYEDRPLPIGFEQTISQPLIVGLMTEALELTGSEKVLEIGTGSGYQTAILAELAGFVISVERLPELAESAKNVLDGIGYGNIDIHVAGETLGLLEKAPYDAIIATAGAPGVPPELVDQMKIGGRMIIPVGSRYLQELYRVTRQGRKNRIEKLGGCRFVSLIGKGAWEE